MAVYRLSGDGKFLKMTNKELAVMAKRDKESQRKLLKAIMGHFQIPYKNNKDVEKFREWLYNRMTAPTSSKEKEEK